MELIRAGWGAVCCLLHRLVRCIGRKVCRQCAAVYSSPRATYFWLSVCRCYDLNEFVAMGPEQDQAGERDEASPSCRHAC